MRQESVREQNEKEKLNNSFTLQNKILEELQQRIASQENQIKELQVQLSEKSNLIIQQQAELQMKGQQIEENKPEEEEKRQTNIWELPIPLTYCDSKPIVPNQIYKREALSNLLSEYKHNPNIQQAIQNLSNKFNSIRKVRGDGNCYFRAIGFSYLEHLIRITTPDQHLQDFISKLETGKGYFQTRPDKFNNISIQMKQKLINFLLVLMQKKINKDNSMHDLLTQQIQDKKGNLDEALIWQMRCLSANYLESHQDYFKEFSSISYQQLIENVLTMGKEAEELGIGPLQVVLKTKIEIVQIDRNNKEVLSFEQINVAGICPIIYILYKPGHYDILYSKKQSDADGFRVIDETFQDQKQIPANYDILNPGLPFFTEIIQKDLLCPSDESKDFKIKVAKPYISTEDMAKISKEDKVDTNQNQVILLKCENCNIKYEEKNTIFLECSHRFCRFCLDNQFVQKYGVKLDQNEFDRRITLNCSVCETAMLNKEIKNIFYSDKEEKSQQKCLVF